MDELVTKPGGVVCLRLLPRARREIPTYSESPSSGGCGRIFTLTTRSSGRSQPPALRMTNGFLKVYVRRGLFCVVRIVLNRCRSDTTCERTRWME